MKELMIAERLSSIKQNFDGILLTSSGMEWDFMTQSPGQSGVFSSLISKLQDIGASGYELMLTLGIIGLVFSIIFTAVSLLLTSNAQKKEEKKSHALVICLAGIVIFSVFSIIGFFKSIGTGL
ncbi:hypothetical protein CLONEX_03476 [[Clostridium] nexile DSM 1787]|nr:hypothetical protein CLONEX_03476 [[Clostridium] nexile DSM 1787]